MASSVTAPLERQFGQMPGLKQMTSTSSFGSSVITLQFDLALNIDVAEQEVQAAVNASGTFLPRDLPNPPVYSKVNPADAPVLTLALTLRDAAALAGAVAGRHAAGAEDLAAAGRRAGVDQRRPEAGRPRAGEPDRAGGLRHRPVAAAADASPTPTRTRRKARSTDRGRRTPSAPTISSRRATHTGRSSSRTATAGRSASPTSPTSSTASRTRIRRRG